MAHKDAYYFPHDSNAKDDPKIVWLIEQLGLEGYGIYWVLIETLRDQPGYRYPVALIPPLARRYNTTTEKVKAVIVGYELFQIDDDNFFSISLMARMSKLDEKRDKAKKAIETRWERSRKKQLAAPADTNVLPTYYSGNTKERKGEEIKGEESKTEERRIEKKTAHGALSNVFLSDSELNQLQAAYENSQKLISKISTYLANASRTYENHYALIVKIAEEDNWPKKKIVIEEPVEKIDVAQMPDEIREQMKRYQQGLNPN